MSNIKLTIGMATFDDYEGVYFTIQSLRMHHPILNTIEYEILVLDNNPSSKHGELCKNFIASHVPNGSYIPYTRVQSSFSKYELLKHAKGEIYLGIDCHVLLTASFFEELLAYYSINNNTKNMVQGPLFTDNLKTYATQMKPEWRGNMFGTWLTNKEDMEKGVPFQISLHGMGMFSCLTRHFPDINPRFQHFGGEEGYIHEKIRQNGGVCLCNPKLGWIHRFNRPYPLPYTNTYDDIYRNYAIGSFDLNHTLDNKFLRKMDEYFEKFLTKDKMTQIKNEIESFKVFHLIANNPLLTNDDLDNIPKHDIVVHFNKCIHINKFKDHRNILFINNYTSGNGGLFFNIDTLKLFDTIYINILMSQKDNPNIIKNIEEIVRHNPNIEILYQEDIMTDITGLYPSIGLTASVFLSIKEHHLKLYGFTGGYQLDKTIYAWGNHSWCREKEILKSLPNIEFIRPYISEFLLRNLSFTPFNFNNKDNYRQLYTKIPSYGQEGLKHVDAISNFVKTTKASSIIDFGCGKNYSLLKKLDDLFPNIIKFGNDYVFSSTIVDKNIILSENIPNTSIDVLFSIDVLEHLDTTDLKEFQMVIDTIKPRWMYHIISTRKAFTLLPDGTNCHKTVWNKDGWESFFTEYFPNYKIIQNKNQTSDEILLILEAR